MFETEAIAIPQLHLVKRGAYTDKGPRRKQNEDACALPPFGVNEEKWGTLLVVADGVGGLPNGAEASQEAVHHIQALYYAEVGPQRRSERLEQAIEDSNLLNFGRKSSHDPRRQRLTTLVAAVVYRDEILVANLGDSRAYLVNGSDGRVKRLTEDHSQHQKLLKLGYQDRESRDSGQITRAIGLHQPAQVDIYRYNWRPGDKLILCTDGLSRVKLPVMAEMVLERSPQEAAEALVQEANQVDGSDNSTAIVATWQVLPMQNRLQQTKSMQKEVKEEIKPQIQVIPSWTSRWFFLLVGMVLGGLFTSIIWLYYLQPYLNFDQTSFLTLTLVI